mmetsp:Transcript_33032/g.77228  ORF Transcript_33032/g.77228 Transcript_33032/m.77228 type:complete len:200 (-) Transcript_33032:1086-1685(-)
MSRFQHCRCCDAARSAPWIFGSVILLVSVGRRRRPELWLLHASSTRLGDVAGCGGGSPSFHFGDVLPTACSKRTSSSWAAPHSGLIRAAHRLCAISKLSCRGSLCGHGSGYPCRQAGWLRSSSNGARQGSGESYLRVAGEDFVLLVLVALAHLCTGNNHAGFPRGWQARSPAEGCRNCIVSYPGSLQSSMGGEHFSKGL